MDDVSKQLLNARWITETTGAIHAVQVDHMVTWMYLILPTGFGLNDFQVSADSTIKLVKVEVSKDIGEMKNMLQLFQCYQENVRSILGTDWRVRIAVCNKVIFDQETEILPAEQPIVVKKRVVKRKSKHNDKRAGTRKGRRARSSTKRS